MNEYDLEDIVLRFGLIFLINLNLLNLNGKIIKNRFLNFFFFGK